MYKFDAKEMSKFNRKPGIYALIHNDEVIYVGQSVNLGKRLRDHSYSEYQLAKAKEQTIQENGRCNRKKQMALYEFITEHRDELLFTILVETDELNKYEEQYITQYQPRFNYKGVDVPY